jgi:hypothetical protein
MDTHEARTLLSNKLAEYRAHSYSSLAARINTLDCAEVLGSSGAEYQIEVQFLWDDQPGGSVHVMGGIDDGGLHAFVPICDSFIIAPDGTTVGDSAA